MRRSLRRRLFLAACLWIFVLTTLGGVALSMSFRSTVTGTFDDTLADELRTLIASVETAADGTWWLRRQPDNPNFAVIYSGHYWQIDEAGRHSQRSRSLWDEALPTAIATEAGPMRYLSLSGPSDQPLRAVRQSVALPRLHQPLGFQVAMSRTGLDAQIGRFDSHLAIALLALALGLIVAVWLQVNYGLRPLRHLAGDLRAVRSGRKQALDKVYPTEVMPLVDELGVVLDHNRRLTERARSSSADLAHALKTPLSVVAAELHAPGDDWRSTLGHEVGRIRALIDRHLARAATVGQEAHGQRTPVAPVVDAVIAVMRRLHSQRNLQFVAQIAPGLDFAGDNEDLEEMLGNLIDNAGKWASRRVAVTASRDADRLIIDIIDDGPGLTPDQRDSTIQRGRRFDEHVPGSGLGLAIVDDIVASYAGRIDLAEATGGGLRVRLELPAAAQEQDR